MVLERLYSKKEEKPAYINDDADLKKYRNKDGVILSMLPGVPGLMGGKTLKDVGGAALGIPLLLSGLAGRYAGNRRAESLDRSGKKDKEIKVRSTIHGGLAGALAGAGSGALLGSSRGHTGKMTALGALLGGIGGTLGTRASVEERLNLRKNYADRS